MKCKQLLEEKVDESLIIKYSNSSFFETMVAPNIDFLIHVVHTETMSFIHDGKNLGSVLCTVMFRARYRDVHLKMDLFGDLYEFTADRPIITWMTKAYVGIVH